jgi:transposase InsO family protein
MSVVNGLSPAVVISTRHCREFGCDKCRAQSRWRRRKAWRSRKSPNRSARDRKR